MNTYAHENKSYRAAVLAVYLHERMHMEEEAYENQPSLCPVEACSSACLDHHAFSRDICSVPATGNSGVSVMAVTVLDDASCSAAVASSIACLRLADDTRSRYWPGASAEMLTSMKLAVPSLSLALLLPAAWILAAEPSSASAL